MKISDLKIVNGFTLAEVLITLVVIGVVAAMTIPTLVTKYQKEQTVNQLKQVLSQFNQAARLSVPEYGDPATWDYSISEYDFLKKYFKFVKADEMTFDRDEFSYKRSDGKNEGSLLVMRSGAPIISLNSGVLVYSNTSGPRSEAHQALKQSCYAVDLNGFKGPNKFGRDMFFLCLNGETGTVVPHRCNDYESLSVEKSRDVLKNGPSNEGYQCSKQNGRGMWCAELIVQDGWQIKDDYPW